MPANSPKRSSQFLGRHIHFIGVGGSGMSGLARMLLDSGAIVSGSDSRESESTRALRVAGARIGPQDGSLIDTAVELVVRTAAVPDDNLEFQRATVMGLPHVKYAQLLGQVMAERYGIAVCGTHGKTTTTSMIAMALRAANLDPSYVIGATVPQLGGSSYSGRGDLFVVEACEFDRSFHQLHPRVAVITNIEADHLDCYPGGLSEIIDSFHTFIERLGPDGVIVANSADDNVRRAVTGAPCHIHWIEPAAITPIRHPRRRAPGAWYMKNVRLEGGCGQADLMQGDQFVASLGLSVPGLHNLSNAAMALAACAACNASVAASAAGMSQFRGADRRSMEIGQSNGAMIVDDYGHHPTEIAATLAAMRAKYAPRRLICVFQPHQASRTRLLLEQFATCFADADELVLPEIYYVRDSAEDRERVKASMLADRVRETGMHVTHLPSLGEVLNHLRQRIGSGDLVVLMGAGNIGEIGAALVGNTPLALSA